MGRKILNLAIIAMAGIGAYHSVKWGMKKMKKTFTPPEFKS
jgi:hypothetical protein